jgi:hypothetical protein
MFLEVVGYFGEIGLRKLRPYFLFGHKSESRSLRVDMFFIL